MNKLFLEIIQLALGAPLEEFDKNAKIFAIPSSEEWDYVFDLSEKHAILGICLEGIQVIFSKQPELTSNISSSLLIRWIGKVEHIRLFNDILKEYSKELAIKLKQAGYGSCLLKGQAFGELYSPKLKQLRQSGDIDMWMIADPQEVIEWARSTGSLYYYDYHHADLCLYPEVQIELHYRPSISRNLIRNRRLNTWFCTKGVKHIVFNNDLGCPVADTTFSVILSLNHNFWHLLYEGVGLRQMMDLYFIAIASSNSGETIEEVRQLIHKFRLEKFAAASAWLLWELFDYRQEGSIFISEKSPFPKPDQKAGKFLLEEVLKAGNFGHHDSRIEKWLYSSRARLMLQWLKHSFRLIGHYPIDVLWTPIGILRISFWRKIRYKKETHIKNIK